MVIVSVNGRRPIISRGNRTIGTVGEVGASSVTWELPRVVDGFDLSELRLQVHYVNADGEGGVFECAEPDVGTAKVLVEWKVSAHARAAAGDVLAGVKAFGTGSSGACMYRTLPVALRVAEPMEEQDWEGDELVDADGCRVVVVTERGDDDD